ncbi:hypothetical protein LOTGIDRAFT_164044 [Lottia gigantea]|uniref:Uncharacterized protein n=1 Tax=Lottia gigantea TaxID=225164 RepID=V4A642_LOTGI|nr:hypothetical protein LOTGIDRAFT_164044 [Lottia gigantea]ESO90465.1 hypothetical protein LOTGIDRAFT_164044 [Lottia gigantea]
MASMMRNDSCPCAPDELQQLFTVPDTQTAVTKVTKVRKYPLTSDLNHDGPLEFLIPNSSTDFIDLANISLYLKLKVVKEDGTNVGANKKVGPVNNFFHSLFKDVKMRLGKDSDMLVTASLPNYPYRAYLENLLSFGRGAKNNQLNQQVMWEKDTAGQLDSTQAVQTGAGDTIVPVVNHGLGERRKKMDGVDVRIQLERQQPKFYLMWNENNEAYKVELIKAYLEVPFVTLAPSTYTRIAEQLQSNNAKYPLKRVVVKDISIPSRRRFHVLDNLFINEVLPKRLILGLVENDSYDGNSIKNPFKFHHHRLEYIKLMKNGDVVEEYFMDFPNKQATTPYLDLKRVGILNSKEDLDMSYNDYIKGYTLFGFDLTNDHGADQHFPHEERKTLLVDQLRFPVWNF